MSRKALRLAAVMLLLLIEAAVVVSIVMRTSVRPALLVYLLYVDLSLVIGTIATTIRYEVGAIDFIRGHPLSGSPGVQRMGRS